MQKINKKVFITGGGGFIGKAVARHLQDKGFSVKTFDIVRPDEVAGEHTSGTIMYPNEVYNAAKGCDYAVHLAAMLGVKRTEENRMDCLDVNILGTKNVFENCVKAGVKKIIFSSSSEVYGEANKPFISESDPVYPKSVYAVTKLAGEEYLKAFSKSHGVDFSIVRFFNVYGPGQVAEFVMPRFIKSVMEDKSPVVYGDGKQIRSFCHASDAAEGVYLALTLSQANSETFNIGNDSAATTMGDLARKVIKISGKNIEPNFVKMEQSDRTLKREILTRIPDISKARNVLGYAPKVALDEGIMNVIKSGDIKNTWQT